jgi:hypothetical protein
MYRYICSQTWLFGHIYERETSGKFKFWCVNPSCNVSSFFSSFARFLPRFGKSPQRQISTVPKGADSRIKPTAHLSTPLSKQLPHTYYPSKVDGLTYIPPLPCLGGGGGRFMRAALWWWWWCCCCYNTEKFVQLVERAAKNIRPSTWKKNRNVKIERVWVDTVHYNGG